MISQKRYDEARRQLAGYAKDEKNMRIVERGAIEYGRKAMRADLIRALTERGQGTLAKCIARMVPR